jgi:O-methyltransferase involved in polyketide biosynthesis
MDKVKIHDLTGVSETLLIPLYYRAAESQRPDAILKDDKAAEMVKAIDYDFSRAKGSATDQVFRMMLARQFDRFARGFLEAHPDGAIVDAGCGLDTRFWRLDNGALRWFELDLPEVIALRQQLLGETPRRTCLAASVFDLSWMDAVAPVAANGVLVLAEGVFPYLERADVQRMVQELQRRFPGAELVFDAYSPFVIAMHRLDPASRAVALQVSWGVKNGRELESWGTGIQLLHEWFHFDEREPRLGAAQWLRFVPGLRRVASILHYRLG